jgi:hypothetical protein
MRNTLVGASLAVVLVAGLFAASHYFSRPGEKPASALNPGQIASQIKPDFVGEQRIGQWRLVCGRGKELPRPPATDGHMNGNSEGTAPKEAPPPPGWKIPRCRAVMGLRSAHAPEEQVRLWFRQFGFRRVLALVLRFPPDEVQTGDIVNVRLDRAEWQIPVRSCAAQFCLAIQSIKFVDVPVLEKSKQLVLSFKPASNSKDVAIAVPVSGLAESLQVMRRIDK